MSRYIDVDFEIAHYTSMTTHPTPDVTEQDKRNSLIVLNALRMAKTIDIVRCSECKHWHDHITSSWCSRGAELRPQESGWIKRNADDFCSYGEREGE